LPVTGCSSSGTPTVPDAPSDGANTQPAPGILPPIAAEDRAPIPERTNALNNAPPVPSAVTFPEFEALRATYLINEDPETAKVNVRTAARAFGAMLMGSVKEPVRSALNLDLPGHPVPVPLPASLNMLGRAAMYQRDAVTGIDVGPSEPDVNGRVWVAIFQGASGPIGSVEAHCVAVTMRSLAGVVNIELVEIPARLDRQPVSRSDFPVVLCELDLDAPPDDGFVPAA
jgi:hypothetical protein